MLFLSKETLKLNNDTFQKHVQSLLESKLLIASSEALEPTAEIKLNFDYSNKRTKFKISAALQKETQQEVEHTMSAVDDDRKLYLQAAIVRIMKSRKILKHNMLIQEVISKILLVSPELFFFCCRFCLSPRSTLRPASR